MTAFDEGRARRVGAASVSHGGGRRLLASPETAVPGAQDPDYQIGFDLGYRDGMAHATAEVETASIAARLAWESQAQSQHDQAMESLAAAQEACAAAAEAMAGACADEHAWATGAATEIAYTAVVRLLGQRHVTRELMASLCVAASREIPERPVRIRVAPTDFDGVVAHAGGVAVEADDRLAPGSCELDTPRGRMVAGVAERLTLLRDALVAGLSDGQDDKYP